MSKLMESIDEQNIVVSDNDVAEAQKMEVDTAGTQSKPITIIFCIVGSTFSSEFLRSWTELFAFCITNNINPVLSSAGSEHGLNARNMCLMGNPRKGPSQQPFDGKAAYDYLMWIGSNVVFTVDMFKRLLSHNMDIVSGSYARADLKTFDMVIQLSQQHLLQHGAFEYMTREKLDEIRKNMGDEIKPMEVEYSGMDFMLMKRGVMEKLMYPWFRPSMTTLQNEEGDVIMQQPNNDAQTFCSTARQAGFKIMVDPAIVLGLQKSVVV